MAYSPTYLSLYAGNPSVSGGDPYTSFCYSFMNGKVSGGYFILQVNINTNGGGWSDSNLHSGFIATTIDPINAVKTAFATKFGSTPTYLCIATSQLGIPVRSGYNFVGWYTAASGGTKVDYVKASLSGTTSVDIYAHWESATPGTTVTVTVYSPNPEIGFGATSDPSTPTYEYTTTISSSTSWSPPFNCIVDKTRDGVNYGVSTRYFLKGFFDETSKRFATYGQKYSVNSRIRCIWETVDIKDGMPANATWKLMTGSCTESTGDNTWQLLMYLTEPDEDLNCKLFYEYREHHQADSVYDLRNNNYAAIHMINGESYVTGKGFNVNDTINYSGGVYRVTTAFSAAQNTGWSAISGYVTALSNTTNRVTHVDIRDLSGWNTSRYLIRDASHTYSLITPARRGRDQSTIAALTIYQTLVKTNSTNPGDVWVMDDPSFFCATKGEVDWKLHEGKNYIIPSIYHTRRGGTRTDNDGNSFTFSSDTITPMFVTQILGTIATDQCLIYTPPETTRVYVNNGSNWVKGKVYVNNGSAWVLGKDKVNNGSGWI